MPLLTVQLVYGKDIDRQIYICAYVFVYTLKVYTSDISNSLERLGQSV